MPRVPVAESWRAYKAEGFALLELAEGDQVLDLGCGTGEDVRVLAGLVRGVGVVGVDASEETIAAARAASLGLPWPVDFQVADAYRLPFDDATFDAGRADKVFHHLAAPAKALAELVRVTRPGGRVVVSDADYDTLLVAAPDRGLTRRILHHFADDLPHGAIGRDLPALFRDAGLGAVTVHPGTAVAGDYDEEVLRLAEKAERAASAGVVTAAEAAAWVRSLEAAHRAGRFFCAVTIVTVRGRKAVAPGGKTS
jgi:ubiquinone/menaquinone biosynthesis C-methylase UbiE